MSDEAHVLPDLPDLDVFPTQYEVDATLPDEGFIVYEGFIPEDHRQEIEKSFLDEVLWFVYTRAGVDIDFETASTKIRNKYVRAMFDINLRRELIPDEDIMKNTVANKDNFRKPHINQTDGMVSIHYNLAAKKYVDGNWRFYRTLQKHYRNYPHLAFMCGPERGGVKGPGSKQMKLHIDAGHNFNYPELSKLNYPTRLQCMAMITRDISGKLEKSGTIELLINYHHYFNLFSLATREDGVLPLGLSERRFFVLPDNFEKDFLPKLNDIAKQYTDYFYKKKQPSKEYLGFFKNCRKLALEVPRKFRECKFQAIDVRPGDIVIWSQYLPHRSLANSSDDMAMRLYYSLFPVEKKWWKTEEAKWVRHQYKNFESFYSTNRGNYNYNPRNADELDYIKKKKLHKELRRVFNRRKWIRRATGFEEK